MEEVDINLFTPAMRAEMLEARNSPGMRGYLAHIPSFDEQFRGFKKGSYNILAGRTGQGKTALALWIAQKNLEAGVGVGLVTLEMTPQQLIYRLMAAFTGTEVRSFREGYASTCSINDGIDYINRIGLKINSAINVNAEAVNRLVHKMGMNNDIIIVDYLQLMRHANCRTRVEELTAISAMLREYALKNNKCVFALAQMNRDAAGIKPSTHHLKGSGDLEQDATSVIAIHQQSGEDGSDPLTVGDEVDRGIVDLCVLKNRNDLDPVTVPVRFDRPTMTFGDL